MDNNKNIKCEEILNICKKFNITIEDLEIFATNKKSYIESESCSHNMIIKKIDGAYCSTCGKDFGWWCKEAPTNICDYEQKDGSYNEDNCIHCHCPEERK